MKNRVESTAPPIWVYLLCAWPLALLSLIPHGGWMFGMVVFGVNLLIWKSPMPLSLKIILNPIIGISALFFALP